MTRNNLQKFEPSPSPSTAVIDDLMGELPDLSLFRDDEKQHILNVLTRDEDLRNKHLARFMQLRKEVASLREKSQSTSKSMCARCQTRFGLIFNTGDICPKCSAKVCKQCRLIYNVNDNTWLCQLCCKQTQLMSYSGEWMYALRNASKRPFNSSEPSHESLQPFSSTQDMHVPSSSDSEPEDLIPIGVITNRFSAQLPQKKKEIRPDDPMTRMIIQKNYDEDRLGYVKRRIDRRPKDFSYTQPLPRRARPLPISPNMLNSSSDDVNAIENKSKKRQTDKLDKSNSSILNSKEVLKPSSSQNINLIRHDIDNESIRSSELINNDKRSEKHKLKVPRRHQSFNRLTGSKLSLASKTSEKSSHKHLSISMQSLRNAVHRISHPQMRSRNSLHSPEKEMKSQISITSSINNEDTISLKVPDIHSISNSHANLNVPQSPTDQPKETVRISHQSLANAPVPRETANTSRRSSANAPVPTEKVHISRQSSANAPVPTGKTHISRRSSSNAPVPTETAHNNRQSSTNATVPTEKVHISRQSLANTSVPTETIHINSQSPANAPVPTETVHVSRQGSTNANVPTETIEPDPSQEPTNDAETIVSETTENDHQIETEIKEEIIENHATTTDHDHANSKREKLKVTSQSSLNSAISETKSGFDLDISGTIELKLAYNINKGVLDVYIKKCTDLTHLKRNQLPNPYCKLYLLPDQSKTGKRKTAVKKETTEPVFDETFRYPVDSSNFNTRTLWVSVWSQTSLGHNHFLGEIHIPLIHCRLDKFEEYTLSTKTSKDNIPQKNEQTTSSNQLTFNLTFLANSNNSGIGVLQVDAIQANNITFGKPNSNIICKGVIMPGNIKRKLAIERKGQSPRWDIPLRWENLSCNNLQNISVEISLWREERFRKVMMCFVRLSSTRIQFDEKHARSFDSTQAEKSAWELFLQNPTQNHHVQLPLRPATNER